MKQGIAQQSSPASNTGVDKLDRGATIDRRKSSRRSTLSIGTEGSRRSLRFLLNKHKNVTGDDDTDEGVGFWTRARRKVGRVILRQRFEMFVAFVVAANFAAIVCETDARSKLLDFPEESSEYSDASKVLKVTEILDVGFLAFYMIELMARFFVQQKDFLNYRWNVFDTFVVFTGLLGVLLGVMLSGNSSNESIVVLRSIRMIRLLRCSRVLVSFEELYALAVGFLSCMKTLAWIGALIFIVLTMWSIVAVEFIHPLMADLVAEGAYPTCSWCPHAFAGILHANLTLFQIMSGDGWSLLARPLIEKHPWTAVVLIGVIFTMCFGLLNLITACIVDTAAQARESDIMNKAHKKDQECADAWKCFSKICVELDKDKSGDISIDELREGLLEIPELSAYLSIMGVEEDDLKMMINILDVDGDGRVSHDEFANQLYKMKTQGTQAMVCFIKHFVERMHRDIGSLLSRPNASNGPIPGEPSAVKVPQQNTPCLAETPDTPPLAPLNSTATVVYNHKFGHGPVNLTFMCNCGATVVCEGTLAVTEDSSPSPEKALVDTRAAVPATLSLPNAARPLPQEESERTGSMPAPTSSRAEEECCRAGTAVKHDGAVNRAPLPVTSCTEASSEIPGLLQ